MDRLYQQAVDGAKQQAKDASGAGGAKRRGAEEGAGDRGAKKPKKGPGDLKNVPAHRGAFKRHLRKHTLLFQREGGETARAILVTCDQGKEARCIQSGCELIKMALASLSSSAAAPAADGGAGGGGGAEGAGESAAKGGAEDGDGSGKMNEDMWVIDPGCNGLACVTVEKKGISPLRVVQAMWDHVDELGKDKAAIKAFYLKHKHCYRFIPLEVMCRAVESEILSTVKTMIGQHFSASKPRTFSIVCDVRSCSSLKKMDLIKAVAELVDKEHTVQLYMPDTVILIQVVKAACGISILSGAQRYMRSQKSTFNLLLHAQGLSGAADQAGGVDGAEKDAAAGGADGARTETELKPSVDRA